MDFKLYSLKVSFCRFKILIYLCIMFYYLFDFFLFFCVGYVMNFRKFIVCCDLSNLIEDIC